MEPRSMNAGALARGVTGSATVPLSVVIPTYNEAHQIGSAVRALAWADDVIVVDGGSTDDTRALAAEAGARVLVLSDGTIGGQRNAGIQLAKHPWILALDADERATPELQDEIRRRLPDFSADGYELRFRSFFLGRELAHGAYRGDWHLRLFRRERRYTLSKVHERLESLDRVERLHAPVDHTPFRDFGHYADKVFRYAKWGAEDLTERGKVVTPVDLLVRPVWRFLRDYILFRGFLDGLPGFLVAAFAGVGTLLKYSYRITEQIAELRRG
jgi:glycosyltransferase involved in cell wall biosynthesis